MILFSPAKINIGLRIISRRADGFHNLQSVMYPVPLFDLLEIRVTDRPKPEIEFSQSGIHVNPAEGPNLCELAYELMAEKTILPPVQLHLHKQIPVGAGLGGGSSNATFTLKGLNLLASDPLPFSDLTELAGNLGSDCPYFLHNSPMLMEGRGEILSPVQVNLNHTFMVLLNPGIHVSTAEAYAGIDPATPETDLKSLITKSPGRWRDTVKNDFEFTIFKNYPLLKKLKEGLYEAGALYSSMSGSGSSMYGFFSDPPRLPAILNQHVIWKGISEGIIENPL